MFTALMLGLLPWVAQADLRATTEKPVFSAKELTIIERNAALAGVVEEDPWLVRRVLDALDEDRAGGGHPGKPDGNTASPNPDLEGMGRSSAEAAHDLLQLLKQAGSGGIKK